MGNRPAELLLIQLDPPRGLRTILHDLDRYAGLDPKVAEARKLLGDCLSGLSSQTELESTLAPYLWTSLGHGVGCTPFIFSHIRRVLNDGDEMLRIVDDALTTIFAPEALEYLTQEAAQWAKSSPSQSDQLQRARDELQQVANEIEEEALPFLAVAAAVAAGVAIGVAATEIYHHHVASQSHG